MTECRGVGGGRGVENSCPHLGLARHLTVIHSDVEEQLIATLKEHKKLRACLSLQWSWPYFPGGGLFKIVGSCAKKFRARNMASWDYTSESHKVSGPMISYLLSRIITRKQKIVPVHQWYMMSSVSKLFCWNFMSRNLITANKKWYFWTTSGSWGHFLNVKA